MSIWRKRKNVNQIIFLYNHSIFSNDKHRVSIRYVFYYLESPLNAFIFQIFVHWFLSLYPVQS